MINPQEETDRKTIEETKVVAVQAAVVQGENNEVKGRQGALLFPFRKVKLKIIFCSANAFKAGLKL